MKTCTAEHGEGDSAEIHFQWDKETSILGSAKVGGAVTAQQLDKEAKSYRIFFFLIYCSSFSVIALMSFLQVGGWKCLGFNSSVCV